MGFSKLALNSKVNLSFAAVLVVFITSSAVILKAFKETKAIGIATSEVFLPALVKSGELQGNLANFRFELMALAHSKPEDADAERSKIDEASGNLTIYMKTLEPLLADGETAAWFSEFSTNWDSVSAKVDKLNDIVKAGKNDEAVAYYQKEMDSTFAQLDSLLKQISNRVYEDSSAASNEGMAVFNRAEVSLYACLLIAMLTGLGAASLIGRQVRVSLSEASRRLLESGRSVGEFSQRLDEVSQLLSTSCEETSAGTVQTAASVEEITGMVKSTESLSLTLAQNAESSHGLINEGRNVVSATLAEMDSIRKIFEQITGGLNENTARLDEIVQMIMGVQEKTAVINDIVSQTKLLAFNASVEAARAGEHGKGFAVVAEEVGSLSQVTGKAAKEISDILKESATSVGKIAEETKRNAETLLGTAKVAIERGSAKVENCNEFFGKISNQIANMSHVVSGVASAAAEQTKGVSQVSQAINEIDKATHRNSKLAADGRKISSELKMQKVELHEAIQLIEDLARGASSTTATLNLVQNDNVNDGKSAAAN